MWFLEDRQQEYCLLEGDMDIILRFGIPRYVINGGLRAYIRASVAFLNNTEDFLGSFGIHSVE